MKRINVHIGTLRVKGVAPGEERAIAAGLEAELTRLFSDAGWAGHLSTMSSLEALSVPRLSVVPGTKPARIGAQAARGIVRSLKP